MPDLVLGGDFSAADFQRLEATVTDYPWKTQHFSDSLNAGHIFLNLVDQAQLCGYAVFSLVADEASLLNIAVASGYQGKGLAKTLLQQGLALLEERGAATCFLEVRAGNERAQGLYQSLNFYEVARRSGYYPAASGREDAVIMCLPLSAACEDLFIQ